jgi:molybdate transport system regulatory protein
MAKLQTPTIRLRIDLTPDSALGPGKIALLERIEQTGSLSQAARELGMSYRRAWLLLNDVNRMFTNPATTASVGGSGGGGARLTDLGREIVRAYREIEDAAEKAAGARIAWLASCRRKSSARGAAGRRSMTPSARKSSHAARK